jgi:hypothetical protein
VWKNSLRRYKVSQSNETVSELGRGDNEAKLLRSIPGLGAFFSVLVAKEIDDIADAKASSSFKRLRDRGSKVIMWRLCLDG